LYCAVYNEWYDLVKIILQSKITINLSYVVGVAIQRGNLKMLNLLSSNGRSLKDMTDGFVEYSAILRIIYYNNFDMFDYLKDLCILTNECLKGLRVLVLNSFIELSMDLEYSTRWFKCRFVYDDDKVNINRDHLSLKNLGFLIKYYCENIDIDFAKSKQSEKGYTDINKYFPEYHSVLMSRIQ